MYLLHVFYWFTSWLSPPIDLCVRPTLWVLNERVECHFFNDFFFMYAAGGPHFGLAIALDQGTLAQKLDLAQSIWLPPWVGPLIL